MLFVEGDEVMRVLENDVILRHDSIWPHGLNVSLHIRTPTEISEFRKSCSRHRWPPEAETISEQEIDLERLRKQISLSNKALSTQNSPNNENNSAQISPTTEERDFICVTDVALQNSTPSITVISPKSKSNTEMDKNGRLPPMVTNKKLAPRPASGTQVPRPASAPKPMSTKSPKLSRRAGTGPDLNKSEQTTSSIPCSILSSRIPISPDQKQRKGRSTEALARSKVNSSVDASRGEVLAPRRWRGVGLSRPCRLARSWRRRTSRQRHPTRLEPPGIPDLRPTETPRLHHVLLLAQINLNRNEERSDTIGRLLRRYMRHTCILG